MYKKTNRFEINSNGSASLLLKPLDSIPTLIFSYHRSGASACPLRLLSRLRTTSFILPQVKSFVISIYKAFTLGISAYVNASENSID